MAKKSAADLGLRAALVGFRAAFVEGEVSEGEVTRLMLDHFASAHRLSGTTYYEDTEPRGRGRPEGESPDGDALRDAYTYARQVKRQMKADGEHGYDWDAAKRAAADLKAKDPYFADWDLEQLTNRIYQNGLRNQR